MLTLDRFWPLQPAGPVVGGLLVALAVLTARQWDYTLFRFDTTLRDPLTIALFTTIGFGVGFGLLKSDFGKTGQSLHYVVAVVG